MDLQTRKLDVIAYLIGLKDEDLFQVIEDVVNKSRAAKRQPLKIFTRQDLVERAKKSNDDYVAGNFIDQEDIELESKNW